MFFSGTSSIDRPRSIQVIDFHSEPRLSTSPIRDSGHLLGANKEGRKNQTVSKLKLIFLYIYAKSYHDRQTTSFNIAQQVQKQHETAVDGQVYASSFKPSKVMWNACFSEETMVCTHHTKSHPTIAHPQSNNASKPLVVEYRKSPRTVKAKKSRSRKKEHYELTHCISLILKEKRRRREYHRFAKPALTPTISGVFSSSKSASYLMLLNTSNRSPQRLSTDTKSMILFWIHRDHSAANKHSINEPGVTLSPECLLSILPKRWCGHGIAIRPTFS